MSGDFNTLFLRLEGPLQSWGNNSKFVMRRSCEAPTKSGVVGLICCAMGLPRQAARGRIAELNGLAMGVRADRPGTVWCDYHTVGAGIGILRADGKGIKRTASTHEIETLVTRRYYLCDASFLVALQGDEAVLDEAAKALRNPRWPLYLGRRSCPPAVPVVTGRDEDDFGRFETLEAALASRPWRPRSEGETNAPGELKCILEWQSRPGQTHVPPEAETWDDTAVSFDPPVHAPRLVCRTTLRIPQDVPVGDPLQPPTPAPSRPRADYTNTDYRNRRRERLIADAHLCVFCKAEAQTVQHITYRLAGGNERLEDLRSLCRLCHDAVTMIEYGLGMGLDRINPEDPRWRDEIIEKRAQIIAYRSLATRRRYLKAEEVD